MLDAPSVQTNYLTYNTSEKNAYLDAFVKLIGYTVLNNVVGIFDGTYWRPMNDATKVLSGDFKVQVPASDIGGVAGNGLIYTSETGDFSKTYTLVHFGVYGNTASCNYVNEHMNGTNVCAKRGMRLPLLSETKASISFDNSCGFVGNSLIGVPYNTKPTFTSSTHGEVNGEYSVYVWDVYGLINSVDNYNNVRCVR